jgi:hypothetical protein
MHNEVFYHLADNPVLPWYFSFFIKVAEKPLLQLCPLHQHVCCVHVMGSKYHFALLQIHLESTAYELHEQRKKVV